MEKLIVLGTGHAMVTKCYNTCFAICRGNEYFLIDAGGGNGVLSRFEELGLNWSKLHNIFITHEHTDHLLGLFWVIRKMAGQIHSGKYEGNLYIYCHLDLVETIKTICQLTMSERIIHLLGKRIILVPVQNGDIKEIIQSQITFFDLQSEKCKQFGFTMSLKDGKKLSFLGDEPYQPSSEIYVKESDWLLSEAFCLDAHRSRYHPEKIQHSTVKEACEIAQYLKAKNLVLWHTEDDHLSERRELYTAEGQKYFQGQIFVPDDLEIIEL